MRKPMNLQIGIQVEIIGNKVFEKNQYKLNKIYLILRSITY
jgi:hypothetical protein